MVKGGRRGARRIAARLVPAAAALLLWPGAAHACAVCYGAGSDPMIDGTRWSVVFLLVLTYLLLGGGGALFVLARRSARRHAGEAGDAAPGRIDRDASIPQASTRGLV